MTKERELSEEELQKAAGGASGAGAQQVGGGGPDVSAEKQRDRDKLDPTGKDGGGVKPGNISPA